MAAISERTISWPKCTVCTEDYDRGSRIPTALPCTHTFCQTCVQTVQNINRQCPTCRGVFRNTSVNRGILEILPTAANAMASSVAEHQNRAEAPVDNSNLNFGQNDRNPRLLLRDAQYLLALNVVYKWDRVFKARIEATHEDQKHILAISGGRITYVVGNFLGGIYYEEPQYSVVGFLDAFINSLRVSGTVHLTSIDDPIRMDRVEDFIRDHHFMRSFFTLSEAGSIAGVNGPAQPAILPTRRQGAPVNAPSNRINIISLRGDLTDEEYRRLMDDIPVEEEEPNLPARRSNPFQALREGASRLIRTGLDGVRAAGRFVLGVINSPSDLAAEAVLAARASTERRIVPYTSPHVLNPERSLVPVEPERFILSDGPIRETRAATTLQRIWRGNRARAIARRNRAPARGFAQFSQLNLHWDPLPAVNNLLIAEPPRAAASARRRLRQPSQPLNGDRFSVLAQADGRAGAQMESTNCCAIQ